VLAELLRGEEGRAFHDLVDQSTDAPPEHRVALPVRVDRDVRQGVAHVDAEGPGDVDEGADLVVDGVAAGPMARQLHDAAATEAESALAV